MDYIDKRRWRFEGILDSLRWLFSVPLDRLAGFAIGAYFSGWHYLDAYFSHFNVNSWTYYSFNDYTIFLYSFFVLVEIPEILCQRWTVALPLGILIVVSLWSAINFPARFPAAKSFFARLTMAAAGLWCLYVFSVQAGQIRAQEVSHDLDRRRIILTLAEGFKEELKASRNEAFANQFLEEMRDAGLDGRLALIWRSSNETLVLLNDVNGKPQTTYRLPNKFVTLIDAKMED